MIDIFNKFAGPIFLYVVGLMMSGVLAYQMIRGIPLNDIAVSVVLACAGVASHGSGVQQGVVSTNDTVNKTAQALPKAITSILPKQ